MSSHIYATMPASIRTFHGDDVTGTVYDVSGVSVTLLLDSGAHVQGPITSLVVDPTEARRRLETAGAPAPAPDYEAVGRGIVKQLADGGMLGGGDTPGWRIIADLGEAIGRGIASARGGGA